MLPCLNTELCAGMMLMLLMEERKGLARVITTIFALGKRAVAGLRVQIRQLTDNTGATFLSYSQI